MNLSQISHQWINELVEKKHIHLKSPSAPALSLLLQDGAGGWQVNKGDLFWSIR